jgi:hypothetical protein
MRANLAFALVAAAAACTKAKGVANEQFAREDIRLLVETCSVDVAEIERGLPEGAKRLGAAPLATRSAQDVATVRRQVLDLNSAKTVVFGVVNLEGQWVATDAENDPYAGMPLGKDTERLLSGATSQPVSGNVYARQRRGRHESAYLAASAIRDAKGNVDGYFVTGVSLAEYAYRLQEALRNHWAGRARSAAKGKDTLPIFYVVLATPTDLYPAPRVPSVDVEALRSEGVFPKARTNASGNLSITDRNFAYATAMLPKLGGDIAVAVLHSEP